MEKHDKQLVIKTAVITGVVVLLFTGVIKYFTQSKTPPLPVSSVVLEKPKLTPMTEYVTQTGTIVAFNSVDLVARIEGYLDSVNFVDGTYVKKGDPLFIVEPQPYLEKLNEAKANLVIQQASYAYAKTEYERQQRMYKQNATSLNNVEKWSAQAESAHAEITKAEANVAVASINYSYTHVLAPFDGRLGRHLVDPGNLVGNGKATNLATIEQIDPIYVYFNLNELDLIKIREAARVSGFKSKDINKIPVFVRMQNETGFPHQGKLDFVNTGLNASTGTLEFRALLENKNRVLLPGLFVQVRVPIHKPVPQLTIPDTAVQYDQVGAYLLVADKNNIVVVKRVVLGGSEGSMRAIVKGLNAQDRVIVSGIQNATPGHSVSPVQNEKK